MGVRNSKSQPVLGWVTKGETTMKKHNDLREAMFRAHFRQHSNETFSKANKLYEEFCRAEEALEKYEAEAGIVQPEPIKDFSVYKKDGFWTPEGVAMITPELFTVSLTIDAVCNGSYRAVHSHKFDGEWVFNEYMSLGSIMKSPTDFYLIDYCTPEGMNAYVEKCEGVEYEEGCSFGKIKEKFPKHIEPFDTYGTWSLSGHGSLHFDVVAGVAFEMWRRRKLMEIRYRERGIELKFNDAHFEAYCASN